MNRNFKFNLAGNIASTMAGVFIERREEVKIMYITDGIFALTDFLLAGLLFSTHVSHIIMAGLYMNATVNTNV